MQIVSLIGAVICTANGSTPNTVAGYLAIAGRALPVGTARTLLGGWNPDQPYWLTDVLTSDDQPSTWHDHDRSPSDGSRINDLAGPQSTPATMML